MTVDLYSPRLLVDFPRISSGCRDEIDVIKCLYNVLYAYICYYIISQRPKSPQSFLQCEQDHSIKLKVFSAIPSEKSVGNAFLSLKKMFSLWLHLPFPSFGHFRLWLSLTVGKILGRKGEKKNGCVPLDDDEDEVEMHPSPGGETNEDF